MLRDESNSSQQLALDFRMALLRTSLAVLNAARTSSRSTVSREVGEDAPRLDGRAPQLRYFFRPPVHGATRAGRSSAGHTRVISCAYYLAATPLPGECSTSPPSSNPQATAMRASSNFSPSSLARAHFGVPFEVGDAFDAWCRVQTLYTSDPRRFPFRITHRAPPIQHPFCSLRAHRDDRLPLGANASADLVCVKNFQAERVRPGIFPGCLASTRLTPKT